MSDNKYNLSIDQIAEIIDKGIEYGAYSPDDTWAVDIPLLQVATEIIDFCIDAWGEGIGPDDEDPEISEVGGKVIEILKVAKVVPDA